MLIVCIVSYFVAGCINLFYGRYGSFGLNWFQRAMIYPVTAIFFELPNILLMYVVHLNAFRGTSSSKKTEEVVEKDAYEKKTQQDTESRFNASSNHEPSETIESESDGESQASDYFKDAGFMRHYEQTLLEKEFEHAGTVSNRSSQGTTRVKKNRSSFSMSKDHNLLEYDPHARTYSCENQA